MYLHSYTTKAQDVCQWPSFDWDALVFGVELEMEPRGHSSQGALLSALGNDERHFFCKSDGSLSSGVELVTVPLSLDGHRALNWRRVLRGVLPIGMSGARTSACGMHVHVNRRALSPLTLAKLLLFVNAPEHLDMITSIAQRGATSWARYQKKTWGEGKNWQENAHRNGRYQALNVIHATAEFRIFRGSLRWDRILKNLEFCHASVIYCRETSAAKIVGADGFLSWVTERRAEYPMLTDFLTEIGAGA